MLNGSFNNGGPFDNDANRISSPEKSCGIKSFLTLRQKVPQKMRLLFLLVFQRN